MAGQDSLSNGSSSNNKNSSNERPREKDRGLARKTREWGKTKLNIEVNDDWQPCGGDYKALATQIGFFMDGHSFPLTETWKDIDLLAVERVWKEIEDNTNLPPESKKACVDSMSGTFRSWRDWKGRVKKNGYYAYNTNEERLANCPDGVVAEQWSSLKVAKINKECSKTRFFGMQQERNKNRLTEREAYKIEMAAHIQAEREAHRTKMEAFKKEILFQLQSQQ